MAEHRGRPFAYLLLILSVWTSARWGIPSYPAKGPERVAPKALPSPENNAPSVHSAISQDNLPHYAAFAVLREKRQHAATFTSISGLPTALDPRQNGGRPSGLLESLRLVPDESKPQSAGRDTPPTIALAPVGKAGTHPLLRHTAANVYAYSFWRLSTGRQPSLAPAAQYGGSQSGVILTYKAFGESEHVPALLVRAAATPDGTERELAFGLRWKPQTTLPVTLTAERRLRGNAKDAFAVYLAGGVDAMPLVRQWNLKAFGQAGYVSGTGSSGSGFFDAQARLLHPLMQRGAIKISGGAGAWAGGQKGASRLDIGPTISAAIDTGPTPLLIQLDWRLRVAGNAEPKNGVAMTVSTGF